MLTAIKEDYGQFTSNTLPKDTYNSHGLKKVLKRNKGAHQNLKGGLMMILPINEMISSSSFKSKICKKELIETLGYLFENSEAL